MKIHSALLLTIMLTLSVLKIDSEDRPSWQAQLSGQKIWTLIPPPECEHVCTPKLATTMNKGEVSK